MPILLPCISMLSSGTTTSTGQYLFSTLVYSTILFDSTKDTNFFEPSQGIGPECDRSAWWKSKEYALSRIQRENLWTGAHLISKMNTSFSKSHPLNCG